MAAATAAQKCGREELSNIQIRGGSQEELPYFKGKEQWLRFAGAAVKKDHTSKVRETQEGRHWERASEGRQTETTITDN